MNWLPLLPELMLLFTLVGLLIGETVYRGESRRLLTTIAIVGQVSALVQVLLVYQRGAELFLEKTAVIDGVAIFFKFLFIVFGIFSTALSVFSKEIREEIRAEFLIFQISGLIFLCLLSSAVNLILICVCLFALNAACYFLSSFSLKDRTQFASGAKIYLFSSVSFFLFLLATAMIFVSAHTTSVFEVRELFLAQHQQPLFVSVISALFLSSLLIQGGLFPFHTWFVDALDGTPTPTEFFMITALRGAGFIVLIRLLGEWMALSKAPFGDFWKLLLTVSALCSIAVGAVAASVQKNLKRLIAYLVVAETGYWLLALTELDSGSVATALFGYMCDALSLCGAYIMVSESVNRSRGDSLDQFSGQAGASWLEYVCTAIFLLSFVGVPPFPGFYAKWLVVGTMFRSGNYAFGIAVSFFVLVQLAAVVRYLHAMIHPVTVSSAAKKDDGNAFRRKALSVALVVPLLASVVFLEKILDWSERAIHFILW